MDTAGVTTTTASDVAISVLGDRASPWDQSNLIGRLFYTFAVPTMRLGAKRPLQLEDLCPIPQRDRAWVRVAKIQRMWSKEITRAAHLGRAPVLLYALADAHRFDLVVGFVLTASEMATLVAQPLILRPFISWLGDDAADSSQGVMLAGAMTVLTLAQALLHHANFYNNMRMGWNLRTGMTGVLHAHLLSVSTAALRGNPADKTPPPQIASLVSSDCQRFDNCCSMLHFGPLSIVTLVVVAALLATLVGPLPMIAGVGVMLVNIGLQVYFSRRFATVRKLTAGRTDARARAASEAFGAMLSLKAYGWEAALQERLVSLRRDEASGVLIAHKMRGVNNGLYFAAPAASALALFATHRLVNGGSADTLHVDTAYTALALLNVLRMCIGKCTPKGEKP